MYALNDGIDDHRRLDLAVARVRHLEAAALPLHCDGQHGRGRDRYVVVIWAHTNPGADPYAKLYGSHIS